MLIVYCDTCGLRILQKDMDSGGVVQMDENKYLCAKCAPAQKAKAPTGAVPSAANRGTPPTVRPPTAEIRQSKATIRVMPRPSERSTGAVPAAVPASASSAARRAVAGLQPEKPKANLTLPLIAGGVGMLIFIVGLFVAMSGKRESTTLAVAAPDTPPPTNTQKPDAASKLPEKAAEKKPEKGGDEDTRQRALPSWMQNGAEGTKNQPARGADQDPQKSGTVDLRKANSAASDLKKIAPAPESQKNVNGEVIWIDDGAPPGAAVTGNIPDAWKWVTKPDPVFSGTYAHTFIGEPIPGVHQHFFEGCSQGLKTTPDDILFAYVYIDAKNPPKTIMMQWHFRGGWEHRAYWGEDDIPFGQNFSPSRLPMGALPKSGEWIRLEVPAAQIGIEAEEQVTGWSFDQSGGQVYWDKAGVKLVPKVASAPKKDAPPPVPPPPETAKKSEPASGGGGVFALTQTEASAGVKILAKDFQGGKDFNNFAGADVRPSRAIWGKRTPRHKMTASFTLAPGDYARGIMKVTSCKHNANACLISFTINGQEIFSGRDRSKSGGLKWGDEEYEIPSGVLRSGTNELVILNTEDTDQENREPWYMVNNVEIRAVQSAEKTFPPVVSDAQQARLQLYTRAIEALTKKDSEVLGKLEGVLKLIKTPPAVNVFAAAERDSSAELPLTPGVERALELHTQALENFRKKPPTEPIAVEKLKANGMIARVEGNKVFVKAGGIELSVDIASIPQVIFYKTLAIDESKPAGLSDKAAYYLGLGQLEEVQLILKKVKAEGRPPWASFIEEIATLERLNKFDTALNTMQQMLAHGKADTALVMLNGVKKDYPDFLDANKERIGYLTKRLEGVQKK